MNNRPEVNIFSGKRREAKILAKQPHESAFEPDMPGFHDLSTNETGVTGLMGRERGYELGASDPVDDKTTPEDVVVFLLIARS